MGNYVAKSKLFIKNKTIYSNLKEAEKATGETCIDITGKNIAYHDLVDGALQINHNKRDEYIAKKLEEKNYEEALRNTKQEYKTSIKELKGKVKNLKKDELDALIEKIILLLE